ncbi:MAG: FtsX-like permease family protein [Candidatus Aminicenantes bacterium]|nr:FtsX-like permease family protein [Candidatus Aminicenantes bacterium]
MIKNHFKVAWRNLLRFKGHSLINITGLAVSLMFCILALIFVRHERSFDRFHENADRIHLLYHQTGTSARKASGSTPPVLAPTIAESIPGIDRIARVYGWDIKDGTPVRSQERILMMRGFHVDPNFLSIFSFPHVSGERETALSDPSSMVITCSMAENLFSDQDPIGREVSVQLRNGEKSFYVKSIVRLPKSSSMRFDFLIHHQNRGQWSRKWGANNVYTYALLEEGITRKDMESRLLAFFKDYFKDRSISGRNHFGSSQRPVKLMPLPDMYLNTEIREWLTIQSDPASSSILTGIALAVLIACMGAFGLISLALTRRTKEIGIRKVLGASEGSILTLMSKDFLALIGAAVMLACPVTYFLLHEWLQNFAYRIKLDFWPFLIGIMITTFVIISSILFKIMTTARTDPVDALRYE